MQVQGDAWHVQGAGWLVLSDRKEYTEDMRLATLLGQGLMDLEDYSENLVLILSEVGATEPLNFGQVGSGGLFGLLPFP